VVAGITAISAYEAHVVNVTAHIENALKVTPNAPIVFGTVFPQEYLEKRLFVTTSESFCDPDQKRVLAIDYKIVQKPKCWNDNPQNPQYAPVDYATEQCPIVNQVQYVEMPLLCPYLSKTPVYTDPAPYTDYGVPSFHDLSAIATGTIHKYNDLLDEWIIDLDVPCFEGQCAQDWAHPGWELPAELEDKDFGCDLWIEVTRIY